MREELAVLVVITMDSATWFEWFELCRNMTFRDLSVCTLQVGLDSMNDGGMVKLILCRVEGNILVVVIVTPCGKWSGSTISMLAMLSDPVVVYSMLSHFPMASVLKDLAGPGDGHNPPHNQCRSPVTNHPLPWPCVRIVLIQLDKRGSEFVETLLRLMH